MLVEPSASAYPAETPPLRLTVERVAPTEFDRIIASFDGAAQEVTASFASARWPGMLLEPVLFSHQGRRLAAALVMIWRIPIAGCGVAVSKWGPVLANETAPDREAIYGAALDSLIAEYATRRRMMLSIMPRAETDAPLEAIAKLKARGFWLGTPFPFPDFYFARVRLQDSQQRKGFGQKWRYHLGKSEKHGLQFEAATPADLPRFQRLYDAMSKRKRFPDFSAYQTLPHVLANSPEAIRPRLFFVTKDGRDVAGAVIFVAGRTAAYLYGATSEEALPLRAGYFMHARILSWLRDNTRAEWYDLGGSDGFRGLHQFKKGMVGSAGVISPVPPIASFAAHFRPRVIGKSICALRDGLQRCRRMAGALSLGTARPDLDAPS